MMRLSLRVGGVEEGGRYHDFYAFVMSGLLSQGTGALLIAHSLINSLFLLCIIGIHVRNHASVFQGYRDAVNIR